MRAACCEATVLCHEVIADDIRLLTALWPDREHVPHAGQFSLREPLPEEAPVETPVHAFEHDALHGVGRADDAAPKGVGGHRAEALRRADQLLDMRAPHDGFGVERPHAPHAVHHGMSRKGGHLAGHLLLEAHDHGHRQQHHRDAQRHGNHGDTLHHTGFVLRGALRRPAGDEKGEIHGCFLCWKIYAK